MSSLKSHSDFFKTFDDREAKQKAIADRERTLMNDAVTNYKLELIAYIDDISEQGGDIDAVRNHISDSMDAFGS